MVKFSIVIPSYNRIDLLKECLLSIQSQTVSDYEVIVVDDGSSDGSVDFLSSFDGTLDNGSVLKIVETCRLGPGGARNVGALSAEGAYLSFLDCDDLWMPWALEEVLNVLESLKGDSVVYFVPAIFRDASKMREIKKAQRNFEIHPCVLSPKREVYIGSNAIAAISQELFQKVGNFKEGRVNLEDLDFALRLGPEVAYVEIHSPVCLGYRKHGDQLTSESIRFYDGCKFVLEREFSGLYPGGDLWRNDRERWISGHVRATCLRLVRGCSIRHGIEIYRMGFGMNLRQNRWKFLLLYPLLLIYSLFRSVRLAK